MHTALVQPRLHHIENLVVGVVEYQHVYDHRELRWPGRRDHFAIAARAAIRKVPALAHLCGRVSKVFIILVGLMTVSAILYGILGQPETGITTGVSMHPGRMFFHSVYACPTTSSTLRYRVAGRH